MTPWRGPVSYPAPVIGHFLVEDGFLVEPALEEDTARMDDARWARAARRLWVTPQQFLLWWIARRWVRPRDIRKE